MIGRTWVQSVRFRKRGKGMEELLVSCLVGAFIGLLIPVIMDALGF